MGAFDALTRSKLRANPPNVSTPPPSALSPQPAMPRVVMTREEVESRVVGVSLLPGSREMPFQPGARSGLTIDATGTDRSGVMVHMPKDYSSTDSLEEHRKVLQELAPEIATPTAPPTPVITDEQRAELRLDVVLADCRSADASRRLHGAKALRALSKDSAANRVALVVAPGVVDELLAMICEPSDGISEEAITALLNLTTQDANRRVLPEMGVLGPIVKALASPAQPMSVRETAAAAIFSLSVEDDVKVAAGDAGAVPHLVEVLHFGSDLGKRDACKALFNLSMVSVNKARVVHASGVPALVALLADAGSGVAEKAAAVLANLVTIEAGRDAVVEEEDAVVHLVEVLEGGTPRGKEHVAVVLFQLAYNSEAHRKAILMEVVIPPLVRVTQTGTTRAKDKAKQLLAILRKTG